MATYVESPFASLVMGDQVDSSVYTSPEVFEQEMQRIFGRTWIFIGHASEVRNPGDFKTVQVGRWPLLMTRHSDGRVRVLFNVCRHRGSRVCYESFGNANSFMCMYHGWTYDTAGTLNAVPMLDHMNDLDMSSYGLVSVARVEVHRDFVFASLSPEGPTLAEHLGKGAYYLDVMTDRAPDREILATRPVRYEYDGNWKLQFENYCDNYHPWFLHNSAIMVGVQMMKEKYGDIFASQRRSDAIAIERSFGAAHSMADFAGTRGAMWMDAYSADPTYLEALERRDGLERAKELLELDWHIMIYPNLLLHTRLNHYRVINPVSVDHTEVTAYACKLGGASDLVNDRLVKNTAHHVSALGEIQVDDMQAFNWVQKGLTSGAVERVNFKLRGDNEHWNDDGELEWQGSGETMMRMQYQEWARLMSDEAR